jgi:hypothetical protein
MISIYSISSHFAIYKRVLQVIVFFVHERSGSSFSPGLFLLLDKFGVEVDLRRSDSRLFDESNFGIT